MEDVHITPWNGSEQATEADIKRVVTLSGLEAMRWYGEANKEYTPHHHGRLKTLWCAVGDITFFIDGEALTLQPGDRLVLPAGTVHSAVAGPEGVVCFEAPPLHENTTVPDQP